MTAPTITVVMTLSRETPGTYVYTASGKGVVVPTLYVQKRAFDGFEVPDEVTVTITPHYAQRNAA